MVVYIARSGDEKNWTPGGMENGTGNTQRPRGKGGGGGGGSAETLGSFLRRIESVKKLCRCLLHRLKIVDGEKEEETHFKLM